ncbi:MAG: hypothetical protein HY830_15700 [Actinobacteria bacterium]|nr:hypothetical protein [Actinomycetota bacterium]
MSDVDGVQLLWLSDYWDGPVAGLALYRGERLWFDAEWDDSLDDWTAPRRYRLRRLPVEELAKQEAIHHDFERMVGTNSCMHYLERVVPPADTTTRSAFYAIHPPSDRIDVHDLPVLANFTTWTRSDAAPLC